MKTKSAKPPVKILIVHAQPNSRDGGGSFRVLSYFLKGIDRERFEVHVALSVLDRFIGEAKTDTIRFLEAYASKLHLLYVPMNQARASVRTQLKFLVELIASTSALWRLMRRERFEIVYTNSLNIFASGIAARLAGITSVYHTHEIVRKPRIIARILARVVGALADRIICVSEAAKAPFLEVGVAADKLVHVPNCIDLDEFNASRQGQKVREEFAANGYEKLVASVGRLIPKKGHDYVIQAAKRVVDEYPRRGFLSSAIANGLMMATWSLLSAKSSRWVWKNTSFLPGREKIYRKSWLPLIWLCSPLLRRSLRKPRRW
jgi:glycosyltransferase involved in cell wall biosynthesis